MTDFWPEPADAVPVGQAVIAPQFTGVAILDEMPKGTLDNPRPSTFIVVSRIGGEQPNAKQDRATLLFEFWAESTGIAAAMAKKGRAALRNSRGRTFIGVYSYGWSNESGPTDFNDPQVQDRRRCQLSGDLLLSTT